MSERTVDVQGARGRKGATVRGWRGADDAWRAIDDARRRYGQKT